jgi:hypothetical protein
MVRSQRAQRARERYCSEEETGVREVETYLARKHGTSMVSTLSPTARTLFGISPGDELTQHVDVEQGCIIIEVVDGGG